MCVCVCVFHTPNKIIWLTKKTEKKKRKKTNESTHHKHFYCFFIKYVYNADLKFMRLFSTRTPKNEPSKCSLSLRVSFRFIENCEVFPLAGFSACSFTSSSSSYSSSLSFPSLFKRGRQIWNEPNKKKIADAFALARFIQFMAAKLFPSFWIRKTFLENDESFNPCARVCVCVWCLLYETAAANVLRCLMLPAICVYLAKNSRWTFFESL